MRLASVRELKERAIAEILPDVVLGESFRVTIAGFAGDHAHASTPRVALGAAVGRRPGQFSLAVRLFDASTASVSFARRVAREAAGEADVRQITPLWAPRRPPIAGSFRRRVRPLTPGYSIGHRLVTAGTLGTFAVDRNSYVCALSNNHVLAASNRGRQGDPIFQNSVGDAQQALRSNVVGELKRAVRLRPFGNLVDAAVSSVNADLDIDPTHAGQLVTGWRSDGPMPGEPVWKVGRTTGVTEGIVRAIEVDGVQVDYSSAGDGTQMCAFDGQIEIVGAKRTPRFSRGGDSGSVILDLDDAAVGLLFAGNPDGVTYANPISAVFSSLGLVRVFSG